MRFYITELGNASWMLRGDAGFHMLQATSFTIKYAPNICKVKST